MVHLARFGRLPWFTRNLSSRRHFTADARFLDDLTSRGFIADITRPEKLKETLNERQVVYAGIDPTARSLHVGHLLPMLCLLHFQVRGHQIIPMIGGATGLVGDPSGHATERKHPDPESIQQNVAKLKINVERFFSRAWKYSEKRLSLSGDHYHEANVLNNFHWLKDLNLLEFLRTIGVSVRVNTMLNRESVRARMNTQQGISFTEFSYQLLQAYDFYILHRDHGCSIQIGGSDQWGNILAGLEMINRLHDPGSQQPDSAQKEKGFGLTTPLLTTASGEKFGKTAGNAVWLDEKLTSVYDFYQFFLKTTDAEVEKYLKMFTLLPLENIADVVERHQAAPEKKLAQRLLADEVTELVHTQDGLLRARAATKILFDSDYSELRASDITSAFSGDRRLVFCEEAELSLPITKLAAKYRLVPSATSAWNLVKSSGLYMNNRPVTDVHAKVTPADLLDNKVVILRAGRDKHLILTMK